MARLKVFSESLGDDVIDEDAIVFWGEEKRVITGADLLGRLLKGIAQQQNALAAEVSQITAPDKVNTTK